MALGVAPGPLESAVRLEGLWEPQQPSTRSLEPLWAHWHQSQGVWVGATPGSMAGTVRGGEGWGAAAGLDVGRRGLVVVPGSPAEAVRVEGFRELQQAQWWKPGAALSSPTSMSVHGVGRA